ncbi:type IV secretion system protein VirB10 [Gilliamella sp. B2824]|uniref:type IV secretion system protein VirB10 n=1 Tax=Gilliamella sp. B2824 TaxID=2818019 RepID=UPI00226ADC6F|nr:type IV secretion system protein VirB10 [Gilliamella sp. B2824]MCX8738124.1 type IV secretion system protein VirB10 [Gilliamella sp. B2824]
MTSNDQINDNEDYIPPLTGKEGKDRGKINVTGRSKNKKLMMLLVLFSIFFIMLLILSSILFRSSEDSSYETKKDEALNVGGDYNNKSSINSTMAEIIRQEEQKKQEEADRKRKQEEAELKRIAEEEAQRQKLLQEAELLAEKNGNLSSSSYSSNGDNSNDKQQHPADRKLLGETLVVISSGSESKESSSTDSSLNDSLKGEDFENGSISQLEDLKFLLSRGTLLPCVLKTKIVTDYPSVPVCILTKDIYSSNGDVLLLRAGTTFMGEQKKVIKQGKARVFVNWTIAQDGKVRIKIDSLGTDTLGASGAPAWVDTHFWERFGGAIMLSFVDDAFKTVSNNLSKSDNRISYDSTTDSMNNMASIALENTINIPPTAYINQGTMLYILVPRDVDFRDIYRTVRK